MNHIDTKIIKYIQGDVTLDSHPFRPIAEELGITEEEVVLHIKNMKTKGIIRRFGAVLRHQNAGFTVNAMVAWKVHEDEADRVGHIISGFNEVSHCYLREVPDEFGYNLFSMIHTRDNAELSRIIEILSLKTGISEYVVLKSVKEMKKVSMRYF